MEKKTPHYKLAVVQALATAGKVRTTHAARAGASELGLTLSDILNTVMAMTSADFYKSMTTYADHTLWQDVYRPTSQAGGVYLKLTVVDDLLIVSFKEL
jgi:motility quorum-sensing regulator/GCU-specific mRNA interferase toxin